MRCNVIVGLLLAVAMSMAGCGGGGGDGGGGSGGVAVAPEDFSGTWSTTFKGSYFTYKVTQSGNNFTAVRTPVLSGLTYDGAVTGNNATVTQNINNTYAATMIWTKTSNTSITAIVTNLNIPPGYTASASVGDTMTLSKL